MFAFINTTKVQTLNLQLPIFNIWKSWKNFQKSGIQMIFSLIQIIMMLAIIHFLNWILMSVKCWIVWESISQSVELWGEKEKKHTGKCFIWNKQTSDLLVINGNNNRNNYDRLRPTAS